MNGLKKAVLFIGLLAFTTLTTLTINTVFAATAPKKDAVQKGTPKKESKSPRIIQVSPKKVIMLPGSIQRIKTGKDGKTILNIEFEKMHPKGKFPVIRIQEIPFKLKERGNSIEFTWRQAAYELTWLKEGEKVSLLSSEPFGEKTFSTKAKQVKHKLIRPGLIVETKRADGVTSKLEVTSVVKGSNGSMEKFSVRTFADKKVSNSYHTENNILRPEFHKQYEKGVNGEILYIFTSNKKGEIFVYYR